VVIGDVLARLLSVDSAMEIPACVLVEDYPDVIAKVGVTEDEKV